MLIALLTTIFIACNNSKTKDNTSTTPTNTSARQQVIVSDSMYTCTMHNEVMSDQPGECPKCGMKLTKEKMTAEQQKMMNEGTYTKPKQ